MIRFAPVLLFLGCLAEPSQPVLPPSSCTSEVEAVEELTGLPVVVPCHTTTGKLCIFDPGHAAHVASEFGMYTYHVPDCAACTGPKERALGFECKSPPTVDMGSIRIEESF